MITGPLSRDPRRDFYLKIADEGSFLSPSYSQRVLCELYQLTRGENPRIVCDIGSGRGNNLPALREMFPSSRLVALDLNWNVLAAGRSLTTSALSVQSDIASLPLRNCEAELAVCTEVLEHVADLAGAVGEIARIVCPRGYAVISSPNYLNPLGIRKWLHDSRHGDEYWDPWGGHPGFERLMIPGLVRRAVVPYFEILKTRGAGYLMAWIPLGYRRIGAVNDRYPLLGLGRWPLFRDVALNRFLLLRKK
jgi:SAM-dependent methyltransferase